MSLKPIILPCSKVSYHSILLGLCPRLFSKPSHNQHDHVSPPSIAHRRNHIGSAPVVHSPPSSSPQLLQLPASCPGCGAYTQVMFTDQPGYYNSNRKSVRAFTARFKGDQNEGKIRKTRSQYHLLDSDNIYMTRPSKSLLVGSIHKRSTLQKSTSDVDDAAFENLKDIPPPVCDRCHHLEHHHSGVSAVHPTVRNLKEIIRESPHKYNHVYHIIDAADFPLSLVTSLQRLLSLSPQRSLNRRSKSEYYQFGRKAELSFIITRSDLLAPKKEQVDSLMPYLLKVLRKVLGACVENARLGNVHCVSCKRGWWTKEVKKKIWNRGGAGWMVGKVNVGKSSLLENIYPKGRSKDGAGEPVMSKEQRRKRSDFDSAEPGLKQFDRTTIGHGKGPLSEDCLLPPAPPETPYPVLPLVSALPGTTISPIRLPFGNGKGELIDLPGLFRDGLESYVDEKHKADLVMRSRVKPEQLSIKPGQSLLLGGLIRITSVTPNTTILAYPFVPLNSHVSSTAKAIAVQKQSEMNGVSTIAKPGSGNHMLPAGLFSLKWDVTRQRSGPLTRKAAAGLSTTTLPFVIFSADVLIEGCGWVELVAQVRKKDFENIKAPGDLFDQNPYPRVEIVSPHGRHIGVRPPMGAWVLCDQKPGRVTGKATRPRRSMKGVKKQLKRSSRVVK